MRICDRIWRARSVYQHYTSIVQQVLFEQSLCVQFWRSVFFFSDETNFRLLFSATILLLMLLLYLCSSCYFSFSRSLDRTAYIGLSSSLYAEPMRVNRTKQQNSSSICICLCVCSVHVCMLFIYSAISG